MNKIKEFGNGWKWLAVSLIIGAMLAGCGSGGGGSGVAMSPISGTAATGAPIVGQVVAIDSSNPPKTFAATTNAAGAYTVNVAGGTAPFILTVTGTSGGRTVSLNSVATAVGQTVNITPLTDLIVSTAAGQPGGATLVSLCTPTVQPGCAAALTAATTGTNLSAAVTAVTSMIAPLNTSNTDPLNGTFMANGTGMDAVLDQILVAPAAAQGAMATVTLIAVPGATLGTVTMPATAGGTSTTATGTATPADITAATTAATSLAEIQSCLASFNALYSTSTMPTAMQVTPFIDASFSLGSGMNQAAAISMLSTAATATAGTNAGMAQQGFTISASALSDFDFTPQTTAAGVTTAMSSAALNLSATTPYAWVKMHMSSSNGGNGNWEMVKGPAYTGCAGGWKIAGVPHVHAHMQARVSKNAFPATAYTRSLPLHVNTNKAIAEGIGSIVVTGPGLSLYSGTPANPVGAATPITLVTPPVPTPPAVQFPAMAIQGFGYDTESIQSCQDLATAATAPAGTPCYDETAVAPGAVFIWTVYDTAATPAVLYAFPFQISAVPLSMAFIQANDKDLFAQNISATPAGTTSGDMTALNTSALAFTAPAPLDDVIKLNYTVSSVYGAQTNHCGVWLTDANNMVILQAEQNADGLPTQQTSCTFNSAGLDSGSLAKPAVAFGGTNSSMYVSNVVLGNQAGSALPYESSTGAGTGSSTTTASGIGSWYMNNDTNMVITFFANGDYMQSQAVVNSPSTQPGLEHGTYTYNSGTGAFAAACPTVDTNLQAGFSAPNGVQCTVGTTVMNAAVTVNGNSMTVTPSVGTAMTFSRVVDAVNPIVGSWYLGTDTNVELTFFANGDYMQSQSVVNGPVGVVQPGLEHGTYTWNSGTGAFATICPTVDTNLQAGFSAPTGVQCTSGTTATSTTVTVSGNTMSIIDNSVTPPATLTFNRVI